LTHLLDSNAWIHYLRQSHAGLVARLKSHSAADIALCSVVLAELYFGAHRSGAAKQQANFQLVRNLRNLFGSLPFDDGAAEIHGQLRAKLAAAGTPIGPNDLMIASIALTNGLTLVTHNTSEFSRVPALQLEDWQTP
jgi:tRNA(fMet)-specific endonuclease VapC